MEETKFGIFSLPMRNLHSLYKLLRNVNQITDTGFVNSSRYAYALASSSSFQLTDDVYYSRRERLTWSNWQSWLWCPGTWHSTSPLLSQVTTGTDGDPSHRLKELSGHVSGVVYRWFKWLTSTEIKGWQGYWCFMKTYRLEWGLWMT